MTMAWGLQTAKRYLVEESKFRPNKEGKGFRTMERRNGLRVCLLAVLPAFREVPADWDSVLADSPSRVNRTQSGVALVLAMILVLLLSTLAVSLIAVTNAEISSNMNYRM